MTGAARPPGRPPAPVEVELFATARSAVGARAVRVPVPAAGLPYRAFVARLGALYPPLRPVLRTSRLVRGDEFVPPRGGRVRPGDRLSVHPPYGGG